MAKFRKIEEASSHRTLRIDMRLTDPDEIEYFKAMLLAGSRVCETLSASGHLPTRLNYEQWNRVRYNMYINFVETTRQRRR